MARGKTPIVRWNEIEQAWTSAVRFPDGHREKVKRKDRDKAQHDLDEILARRANAEPRPERITVASFDDVITAWLGAGCPNAGGKTADGKRRTRTKRSKDPNTIKQASDLLRTHVAPRRDLDTPEQAMRRKREPNKKAIGKLWVDRTSTGRVEEIFDQMAAEGLSESTIYRTWKHLDTALAWGVRQRRIKRNPADECLLPEAKASTSRKSFTIEEATLFFEAIPADRLAPLWLTAFMVGTRPGEILGVRWPMLDIDGDRPTFAIDEAAKYVGDKYVGQGGPKTERDGVIELHPLNVAALIRHREDLVALGRYDSDGFVFPTKNGGPLLRSNVRRYLKRLTKKAGLGENWTTYELRHSFASIADDFLAGNRKFVGKVMGHSNERTTKGYVHKVRPTISHAVDVWNAFLDEKAS